MTELCLNTPLLHLGFHVTLGLRAEISVLQVVFELAYGVLDREFADFTPRRRRALQQSVYRDCVLHGGAGRSLESVLNHQIRRLLVL